MLCDLTKCTEWYHVIYNYKSFCNLSRLWVTKVSLLGFQREKIFKRTTNNLQFWFKNFGLWKIVKSNHRMFKKTSWLVFPPNSKKFQSIPPWLSYNTKIMILIFTDMQFTRFQECLALLKCKRLKKFCGQILTEGLKRANPEKRVKNLKYTPKWWAMSLSYQKGRIQKVRTLRDGVWGGRLKA